MLLVEIQNDVTIMKKIFARFSNIISLIFDSAIPLIEIYCKDTRAKMQKDKLV